MILLRVREGDEELLEFVSRFRRRQLGFIYQVLPHQERIQEWSPRHWHSINRTVEYRFGPARARNIGQIGVVLDRVATDIGREVGALRLQEGRQIGNVLL